MMKWIMLNKGSVNVFFEYGQGDFTSNLFITNTQIGIDGQDIYIKVDLNSNLRIRNKQANTYFDAKDFLDGNIKEIRILQIDEEGIIKRIVDVLRRNKVENGAWYLIIDLQGEHIFKVEPEYKSEDGIKTLFLNIVSIVEE